MNGVHDLGGMDGFGRVSCERDEPVFHEPWESRVFGMFLTGAGLPPAPIDALRHSVERLDPVQYLGSSYYERWLTAFENGLIDAGTLTRDEIEAKIQQFVTNPDLVVPRRNDPARAEGLVSAFKAARPFTRKIRQKPRFAIGDSVVTRNINPHGHTRLPRYARGKRGTVMLRHGAHVFPDTNAHGLGENPQHLYTVSFAAEELWGDGAEANQDVLIDMWETYLERDQTKGAKGSIGIARREQKQKGSTGSRGGRIGGDRKLAKKTIATKSSRQRRKTPKRRPSPTRRGR